MSASRSPVDSFYYDRELAYSNNYGIGLNPDELTEFDTYNEIGGYVSESWDIFESPNSGYIWYIIDGEICPKLFGVGEGKQKNDGGDSGGDSGNESNESGGESSGSGGRGTAEIREEAPVP